MNQLQVSNADIDKMTLAIGTFLSRPSKMTGRAYTDSTFQQYSKFFPEKVIKILASGLRGADLMISLDDALMGDSRKMRSVGMLTILRFCEYAGLVGPDERAVWRHELSRRYPQKSRAEDKILSPTDLRKYFDGFLMQEPGNFTNERLHFYSAILLLTGARGEAIIKLKETDIVASGRVLSIRIPRLKSARNQDQIINVPMDTVLPHGKTIGGVYYEYMDCKPESEYIFVNIHGESKEYMLKSMALFMQRHCFKAKCRHVSPHMFRFTCASIVSDLVGIRQAQQLLGHASVLTTQKYAGIGYVNTTAESIAQGFSKFNQLQQVPQ